MDTYAEQIRLEEESRTSNIEKYYRDHYEAIERNRFGDTMVGRKIIQKLVDEFTLAIDQYMEATNNKHIAHKMLAEFGDNRAAAFLFIKSVLNILPKRSAHKDKTAYSQNGIKANLFYATCADQIHDELVLRHFAENQPRIMQSIVKACDIRALTRQRRREHYQKQLNQMKMEWTMPGWEKPKRVQLGVVLFQLFNDITGALTVYTVRFGRNKEERHVHPTDEFQKLMEDMLKNNEQLYSLFLPMVHPPRPWKNDSLIGLPYLSNHIRPYKAIKHAPMGYLRDLELTDLSVPLAALNAVQSTAWRINSHILEALQVAYEEEYGVEALPPTNPLEYPPLPPNLVEGSKEWKQNKADCAMVHRLNRKAINKRILFLNVLSIARKFSIYERIYFPHEMDSRGRMYPKPAFVNPQGPSHVRALLDFAEGKPIETEEHVAYLAIAGANAYGHDKLPLQDRVDWVFENEDMIISIATDWRSDRRWVHVDDPFGFLRFCMEWKALGEHGPGFISHMPVNLDATCSGLQHFSAILKDEVGGFHVNLTDSPDRQDIYQAVADRVTKTMKEDIAKGENTYYAELALKVGINRAITKRPVMIVPYSGTFKACMKYVESYYLELYENSASNFHGAGEDLIVRQLTPYVAKHIWAAIGDTVIAAREAMDWITQVSRQITKGKKKNEPILWVTPAGLTVRQFTTKREIKDVYTYLHGKMRVRLNEDTNEVDPRRMAQSISPNFIHSMDAAHLQLTVCKAIQERDNMSFSMIHDSFGTHAADVGFLLHECIKPTFHSMYAGKNQLEIFLEQISGLIDNPEAIPPIPRTGSLDLDKVLDSQFFFS